MVVKLLLSIVLGLLPEVLYFTMFLIYAKNLKEKRLKLGILISVAYVVCITFIPHSVYSYIGFIFTTYILLKLLYKQKAQIVDIFLICIAYLYINLLAYISYLILKNNMNIQLYYLLYFIDRICLCIPFIFRNKFYELYKKYFSLWNRRYDVKAPIKSITIRNISLISLNILIFLTNIVIIKIC